ncbi:hypothetical protein SLOPH_2448 [Spraguea lophii 42_110]|uniref:Uncharacterized protein n=1 Tax=Spraguea lophii (strain 42_110) TaxID=1358809 RepID=S7W961_SPRLO|nr:hypothetical protein SLOPH_2448 [Spraguea lophii 42_110]
MLKFPYYDKMILKNKILLEKIEISIETLLDEFKENPTLPNLLLFPTKYSFTITPFHSKNKEKIFYFILFSYILLNLEEEDNGKIISFYTFILFQFFFKANKQFKIFITEKQIKIIKENNTWNQMNNKCYDKLLEENGFIIFKIEFNLDEEINAIEKEVEKYERYFNDNMF